MFSKTVFLLKLCKHRNIFRYYQTETPELESFLKSLTSSLPKQGYSLLFFDTEVQKLLQDITDVDYKKVFKPKHLNPKVSDPTYKLLTSEELELENKKAREKASYLLQIPPLVDISEEKIETLATDPSLDGFDNHHSKVVFTDTSFDVDNEERIVVVREPNGVLRTASKSEKFRMNQIYYPIAGRNLEMPKMFEFENLIDVIKRKEYEFILDRACVQFEPDEQMYHNTITLTYEAINYCEDFVKLLSTRHFGSLAFYLVTHKNIDNLLKFYIATDRMNHAYSLLQIYCKIYPDSKFAKSFIDKNVVEVIKNFIELDSKNKDALQLQLNLYLKREEAKRDVESGIKEAHGL